MAGQIGKEKNHKRAERWEKAYLRQKNLHNQIRKAADDILESGNFDRTKTFIQEM